MIDSFRGEYRWLSNFGLNPVVYKNISFMTSEHAYMWSKTLDENERAAIIAAPSPKEARRLGQLVTLRLDWEDIKRDVMYQVVKAKFEQNSEIRAKLIATGDEELVEGNTFHDNFWGICICGRVGCEDVGKNWLGIILMRVRKELSKEQKA